MKQKHTLKKNIRTTRSIDPKPIPMTNELERKLGNFYWDLKEIKQEMPETVTNYIVDCDEDYVYYEYRYYDKPTIRLKFDVYGRHYPADYNKKENK